MIRALFLGDFPLSSCVWQSTIFLVVGLLGSFILRHRSARAHQVLFLAMIAAVIVPTISILVKHYELGLFVAEPVVIQSQPEDRAIASNYGAPGIISAENIEHKPVAIEEILPSAMAGSESAEFPWRSVVLYGWIAASLILAARLLLTFILGVRLLGRALPLDCQRIKEAAHLAKAKLGIDKDVKVRSSRGIRSPVIWCWRRKPVLLVPSAAGRFDNGVDWAGVLCHELAHYKRRDHISGLLTELVVCILPWHPLLWWAKSRLVRLSEQACDDWVVATGQPGTDYAESLLDLTPGGQMAFVPAVVRSRKGLAGRVHRILQDKCGNPRTGAVWALAVSLGAVCITICVAFAQTREGTEISFLLSPDGRYLGYGIPAYDHDGEEITRLMICKLDGTQQRQVQKVPGHGGEILWLGNDRVICSVRDSLRYAVISLDGATLADIVLPAGCDILYKRISPDGRRVAFVGRFQGSDGVKQTGLFAVELMTGQVRCLIDKALKTAPAWSPDSQRLAIGNSPGYVRYYPLVIVDVETGEISATEVEGVGASWSSDGRFLAFTTQVVRGGGWQYGIPIDGRIGVLDVGTRELIHVTPAGKHVRDEETAKRELQGSLEPVWSPDGQWIAYRKTGYFRANKKAERKRTEETWIVDKEGQGARKVADGFGPIAWAHDSQSLFILKENQIDRVEISSSSSRKLISWEKAQMP